MNITEVSIKRKVVTYTVFFLLIVTGIAAYFSMEKAEDPGFEVKTLTVTTLWPGATTAQMDELVSSQVEEILEEIPELYWTESKNRPGISTVYLNLVPTLDEPLQNVWNHVRRKLNDQAAGVLPKGVVGPIVNDEFGDVYGTLVAITSKDKTYKELGDIADYLKDQILESNRLADIGQINNRIDEVGKVKIYGKQDETVYIDFDNAKLAAMNVSPATLANIVKTTNIVAPSGTLLEGGNRLQISTTGDFKSIDDIRNTVIKIPGQIGTVYLKDIATITRDYVDPATYISEFNGEKAVVVAISLKDGKNNILLGEHLDALLDNMRGLFPAGVNFDYLAYQPGIVVDKINSFVSNLTQAIVTIILVMVLALGLRTGIIVSTLIPIVACMAFLILKSLNMGLDQMSLAGLIIALGMLVDNSIVMSENIMVMMENGKGRMEACLDSANELRGPLLIASIITVSSFAPIFLAEESIGEYTAPIGIVVAICLISSWLIANTLIPLLCFQFLHVEAQETDYSGKWYTMYKNFLLKLLKFKKMTALGAIGIFVLGVLLFKTLPNKFMPDSDKPIIFTELRLPMGSSIEATKAVVDDLDAFVEANLKVDGKRKKVNIFKRIASGGTAKDYYEDGVISWGSFIGGGAPRYFLPYSPEAPAPEYTYIIFNITKYAKAGEFGAMIDDYVKSKFPDVDIISRSLSSGPSAPKDIQYRILSKNIEGLYEKAELVKQKIREQPGSMNISDNWNVKTTRVIVDVDQERVKKSGLTTAEVATSLQGVLTGVAVTDYRENTDLIPIVFRTEADFRNQIDKLDTTNIYSANGKISVPLGQIADIKIAYEPGFIYRWNGIYTIVAQSDVKPGHTANETDKVVIPWLNEEIVKWGPDYSWNIGGEAEQGNKASAAVGAKLPIAGLLIVLLLIIQFNSIRKPLVILLTVPLGLLGVAFGLKINGMNFGFMPLIGLISLCGVVINAAIVLIDRIDLELGKGLPIHEAIVVACLARIRPILLTTLTTVCGLVPLWLFGGTLFSPMAVALLFGLIFATSLTLAVIPSLYAILFKVDYSDFDGSHIK